MHENWTECSLAQHRFPIRFVSFLSVLSLLVRVTVVDKNKAFLCCLLATSVTMLSGKKKRKLKIWSKKWYLKRNISCDAHLPNEFLEMDVPWDVAIVVSAGKLRKLWDSLKEQRSSVCVCVCVCVKDDWKGQFWGLCYCQSKLGSLLSFSVRYEATQ